MSTDCRAEARTAGRIWPVRLGALSCALLLLLVACGAEDQGAPTMEVSGSSGSLVAVAYELEINSEGTLLAVAVRVVSDTERVRSETDFLEPDSFDPALDVWDGERLYSYRPESAEEKHVVHEAPDDRLDELISVQVLGARVGIESFARFCPDADRLGEGRSIADRSAVGYQCGPGPLAETFSTGEVWFDQATGVLLEAGPLHAISVTTRPEVDSATFSTEPPEGVEVKVYPATEGAYGQKAPAFELSLDETGASQPGGTVRLSDYKGRPVVLVPFSSDLYFGPGYECPDCFPSLVTLLEMTNGGKNPNVLAIQSGEVVRSGRPPAPPGVAVTLLEDPESTIRSKYGLSMGHHMAFVFIDGQGLIQHVIDHRSTSRDFEAGLKSIR